MDLTRFVRTVPDHPRPGVVFRDATPLFGDAAAFALAVDRLAAAFHGSGVASIAGIEARGFVLGAALARALGAGFAPIRKAGKLPRAVFRETYDLEYGSDALEIHVDAVRPGETVILCDDLIATGGTALAALSLLSRAGARTLGAAVLIDLPGLGGTERVRAAGVPVHALLAFPS